MPVGPVYFATWSCFRCSVAKGESRAEACFRGPMSSAVTAEVEKGLESMAPGAGREVSP
jgi:hypothetical protein